MTRRGLLLTLTEPPAAMEEEFNAWYDTEHLPERLSIAGFRSARRWVADVAPGQGKYLATYELESVAVLDSPAYLSFYQKPTPWSRRCLGKAVVFKRWACEQADPGGADAHPDAVAVMFNGIAPNSLQTRRFIATTGESIVLCELSTPGKLAYRLYGT